MAGSAASISNGRGHRPGWRRLLSVEGCERDGGNVLAGQLPIPPATRSTPFLRCREPVAVIAGTQEPWRMIGERIGAEQRRRRRVAAQQLLKQRDEPLILRLWRERFEPHQPVETEVVRRNLRPAPVRIARFPLELVLTPSGPAADALVIVSLDDDFISGPCN